MKFSKHRKSIFRECHCDGKIFLRPTRFFQFSRKYIHIKIGLLNPIEFLWELTLSSGRLVGWMWHSRISNNISYADILPPRRPVKQERKYHYIQYNCVKILFKRRRDILSLSLIVTKQILHVIYLPIFCGMQ